MKKVAIYTDGGCRGNGKESNVGGYGIVLIYKNQKKEIRKGFVDTTNNIMELMAVVEALKLLKEKCEVTLYSDSAYVINAINNNWLDSWKINGWVTASKKSPVKNKALWMELDSLLDKHNVIFVKVKGHSTNAQNNRCDELANIAMDEIDNPLI